MMRHALLRLFYGFAALGAVLLMSGCAGMVTMPAAARAGDTIALYTGWQHHGFTRSKITVTFTDSAGQVTTYQPGDSHIRSVVDLYPDPVSYLVVGTRTGLTNSGYHMGATYGGDIASDSTNGDPDWWDTVVYVDTPTSMATGTAQVQVTSPSGASYGPIPLTILPGTGSPATFATQGNGGALSADMLESLDRAPHYTITFSGSTVPAAIEVWLTHSADETAGGSGKAIAINPRGEMKNLAWSDDGTDMHVVLMPSGDGTWNDPGFPSTYGMNYWKFYVSGGVTNVQISKINAYDKNGNRISSVMAFVTK